MDETSTHLSVRKVLDKKETHCVCTAIVMVLIFSCDVSTYAQSIHVVRSSVIAFRALFNCAAGVVNFIFPFRYTQTPATHFRWEIVIIIFVYTIWCDRPNARRFFVLSFAPHANESKSFSFHRFAYFNVKVKVAIVGMEAERGEGVWVCVCGKLKFRF